MTPYDSHLKCDLTHHANHLSFLFACLLLCGSFVSHASDRAVEENINTNKKIDRTLNTRHVDKDGQPKFTNRLLSQNSLYLLQHANNPVQWWPWGDEAFAKAKELNRPIFLSIGYSTCHWCHVMARESFEDIEIADFINKNFIPIKVDREEYPDIDELYLTSVQMLSSKAGWPLTAVLTPDGKAFFGGTYFAPDALLNVLNKISQTWTLRQDAVLEQANRLNDALKNINKSAKSTKAITSLIVSEAAKRISSDLSSAGDGQSKPGFPREPEMLFLLYDGLKTHSDASITVTANRLLTLAASGLHDQVGGGFHRYTVDSNWNIPHFEKMLYNQAQMGASYFKAFDLTGHPKLLQVGEKTFAFLLSEMQSPDGGFYAAMDAESEDASGNKGEGEFYLWSHSQLSSVLSPKQIKLAESALGVTAQGNFNGSNVIHNQRQTLGKISTSANNNPADNRAIETVLATLSQARTKRKPPQIDTKIITSWNSMAISALLAGYQSTGNADYLKSAKKAAERIWQHSFKSTNQLRRTLPENGFSVAASLEDYAYFSNALLDVFDTDGDSKWLERSKRIAAQMIELFHDAETGGFHISRSKNAKVPVLKLVTARDDATFSGNSLAAQVLARLYHRSGKARYKNLANSTISAFSNQLLANPETLSGMLLAASMINNGEVGSKQYAAKGHISLYSKASPDGNLEITLNFDDGWHINASTVLNDYLIPTSLTPTNVGGCSMDADISFPDGDLVHLGFQSDQLSVYQNTVKLEARHSGLISSDCNVLSADLNIQACTDEICLAPEKLLIRAPINSSE